MKLKLTKESAIDLGLVWYNKQAWELDDLFAQVGLNIKGDLDLSEAELESLPSGLM
jgi:hypothetical protein